MLIIGFDWDEVNIDKLDAHALIPADVEWLFEWGNPDVFRHPDHPQRWIALGFVPDERFVLTVFEYNQKARWIRVVTAYEPTSERWWQIYEAAKKKR